MKNIKTAEKFVLDSYELNYVDSEIIKVMVNFAKIHVEAALKAALNNAKIAMKPDMEYYYEDYIEGIIPESILESYPLNNIK